MKAGKPTQEQLHKIKLMNTKFSVEERNKAFLLDSLCLENMRHLGDLKHLLTFGWHTLQLRSYWLKL